MGMEFPETAPQGLITPTAKSAVGVRERSRRKAAFLSPDFAHESARRAFALPEERVRMDNVWLASALWVGLALIAAIISIRIAISVALVEIMVGAIAGNSIG